MTQYFEKEQLLVPNFDLDISSDDIISTDNYDESLIMDKIIKMSQENIEMLMKAAIQISIIGAGNGSFGSVRINENVLELIKIFDTTGVKYSNVRNAKLESDDLTPRRLVRFFRYQIQRFIEKTGRVSYLWNKYANKNDESMKTICFPGAEHIIKTREKADFLLGAYKNLDDILDTSFVQRLERVFIARGVINPGK